MSEKHAVLLLALIATALGGTSLAYNVLDDQRLAIVGVLVTFVLLVQFASFLADVERRNAPGSDVRARRRVRGALAAADRGARRLRPDRRLVRGRVRRSASAGRAPSRSGTSRRSRCRCSSPRATWPSSRSASTARSGAMRASRDVGRDRRRGRRLRGGRARLHGARAGRSATSRARSSSSTRSSARRQSSRRVSPSARSIGGGANVPRSHRPRTIIVGAGRTGRSLLRELRETPGERVVGLRRRQPARSAGGGSPASRCSAARTRSTRHDRAHRARHRARDDPRRAARAARRDRRRQRSGTTSPAGSSGARSTSTRASCSARPRE